jgi:hypothetical protein
MEIAIYAGFVLLVLYVGARLLLRMYFPPDTP